MSWYRVYWRPSPEDEWEYYGEIPSVSDYLVIDKSEGEVMFTRIVPEGILQITGPRYGQRLNYESAFDPKAYTILPITKGNT